MAPVTDHEPRVVLSARGLGKDFGGFTAVNNVDLDVHHARIHALIGPNGAGKTTVFNLLTKFLQPTRGKITLLGTDITRTRPDKVARMGMVRSFQISAVFPHLTVLENVRVALQRPAELAVQFWQPLSALDRLNGRAEVLIEELGLTPYPQHACGGSFLWAQARAGDRDHPRPRSRGPASRRADGRHGPGRMCRWWRASSARWPATGRC